jgi:hypothetical protein
LKPQLVFRRTVSPDRFIDAHTRPKTAERIRKLRERAGNEQQPFDFVNVAGCANS